MRLRALILSALAGAGAGAYQDDAVQPAKAIPIPPVYPIGTQSGSFAKPVGRLFEIDGQVTYFAGTNAWWLGHLSSNDDIDTAMQQIAETQYKVIRVWGFGDVSEIPPVNASSPQSVWYQLINSTGAYINYGEDGLQRLDYVVSTAERLGLKLVLPFVNYWLDLGGQAVYELGFGDEPSWYQNEPSQEVYKDYIKVLVTRYTNSTAIFAWELCNEPRCPGCSTDVITNWASDTSAYIKSLDPNHMVTLGDEGWFGPSNGYGDGDPSSIAYAAVDGVDFVANLNIPTLDYGVFHLYPNLWGYSYDWGNLWISQHDDAGSKANKPVILEEYGSPYPHNHTFVEKPWQDTVLESGIAADQVWQFGPANMSVSLALFGDEFSVYFNDSDFSQVAVEHAEAMLAKTLSA